MFILVIFDNRKSDNGTIHAITMDRTTAADLMNQHITDSRVNIELNVSRQPDERAKERLRRHLNHEFGNHYYLIAEFKINEILHYSKSVTYNSKGCQVRGTDA